MTLLASLLLERRVILVAETTDTVSAAVHAAAALLYPFTWQHIYLPILPITLKVCLLFTPCHGMHSRVLKSSIDIINDLRGHTNMSKWLHIDLMLLLVEGLPACCHSHIFSGLTHM